MSFWATRKIILCVVLNLDYIGYYLLFDKENCGLLLFSMSFPRNGHCQFVSILVYRPNL